MRIAIDGRDYQSRINEKLRINNNKNGQKYDKAFFLCVSLESLGLRLSLLRTE